MAIRAKQRTGINPLDYMGVEPSSPNNFIVQARNPATSDYNGYNLGDEWLNSLTMGVYKLVSKSGSSATWSPSGGSTVSSQFNTNSGNATPAAGILRILGGDNINTTGATNVVTVNLNDAIDLPITNAAFTDGALLLGSDRFLHSYGTESVFLGIDSGNGTLTATGSVGIGNLTLNALTSGNYNVAVGDSALANVTSGSINIAIGNLSLVNATTGTRNVGVGDNTLGATTTTSHNTAIGHSSLFISTGERNTALGAASGQLLSSGDGNIIIGESCALSLSIGSSNTIIGKSATSSMTGGAGGASGNIIIGRASGNQYVTDESDNIAINSGGTTGDSAVIRIGYGTVSTNPQTSCFINGIAGVTPASNIEVVVIDSATGELGSSSSGGGSVMTLTGNDAAPVSPLAGNIDLSGMSNITTSAGVNAIDIKLNDAIDLPITNAAFTAGTLLLGSDRFLHSYGTESVFLGINSGNGTLTATGSVGIGNLTLNALTSGNYNVAVGDSALANATIATLNIAIGNLSLVNATTGTRNVGVGDNTLGATTTTSSNTAIGHSSLFISTGERNTALGSASAQLLSSGDSNIIIGESCALNLSIGSSNTIIGKSATSLMTGGVGGASGNIIIGRASGNEYLTDESDNIAINSGGTTGDSAVIRIGYGTTESNPQTSCFINAIRGVTTVNVDAIAVLIDSDGQLGTISSSREKKENIQDMNDESSFLLNLRPVVFNYKADDNKSKRYGLIAEEVEEVNSNLVAYGKDEKPESVKYHDLPALLLNEFKKLEDRIKILESKQ
jgi:hypothetical protein